MRSLAFCVGLIPAAAAVLIMSFVFLATLPFALVWVFCVWSAAELGVPGFSVTLKGSSAKKE